MIREGGDKLIGREGGGVKVGGRVKSLAILGNVYLGEAERTPWLVNTRISYSTARYQKYRQ